jgi:hypothetical protein
MKVTTSQTDPFSDPISWILYICTAVSAFRILGLNENAKLKHVGLQDRAINIKTTGKLRKREIIMRRYGRVCVICFLIIRQNVTLTSKETGIIFVINLTVRVILDI